MALGRLKSIHTGTLHEPDYVAEIRINIDELWRKRVGVESTIRPAKDRIAGFEGREGHRTPFASTGYTIITTKTLFGALHEGRLGNRCQSYCGASQNSIHSLMKIFCGQLGRN
jgi:hypothetical protein